MVDLAREPDFDLGALRVRPSVRQVEFSGQSETLEPRILQVLVALSRKRGEVISRDELIETCWNGVVVGEDSLNRCIYRLRKLGESSGAFSLETIARVGYRLHETGSPTAPGPPGTEGRVLPDPAPRRKRPVWLTWPALVGGAAAMIVLAGTAIWLSILNSRIVEVRAPGMVAVLRFDAPASDPEAVKIAQTISSYMTNELTRAGVLVKMPAEVQQFAGDRKAEAARSLGARFLVDGSIARDGDLARVFVRIDHAERGMTLWSNTINGEMTDPTLLAERVTALVGRMVSWSPTVDTMNLDRPDAAELTAAYMRGLTFDRTVSYLQGVESARNLLEKAPDVALFHGAYAIRLIDLMPSQPRAERENTLKTARAAARKAVELDARDGAAHLAVMRVASGSHWQERAIALQLGISVDPANGSLNRFLCSIYLNSGQIERARDECALSGTRDPFDPGGWTDLSRAMFILGDRDGAVRLLAQNQRRWPGRAQAWTHEVEMALWGGDLDTAAASLDRADTARQYSTSQMQFMRDAIDVLRTNAPSKLTAVKAACSRPDTDRMACLSLLTILRDMDGAVALADHLFSRIDGPTDAEDDRLWLAEPNIPEELQALFNPWMAPLRADPRIIPIFERVGLLNYWRSTGNWPDFCETEPQSVCRQMKDAQPQ